MRSFFLDSDKLFDKSSLKNEELVELMDITYKSCSSIQTILTGGKGHLRFSMEPYIYGDESPYMSEAESLCSDIRKVYKIVDESLSRKISARRK